MIKENIAFLLHPSLRGRAYIQRMIKNDLIPSEILLMDDVSSKIEIPSNLEFADFYNPYEKPSTTLTDNNIDYSVVSSTNCNDSLVIDQLKNIKSTWVIFSGGGILQKEILSIGKNFIHVHPGKLPQYRGSTCFYYSIIKESKCFCTGFVMDEKLDSGKIIKSEEFNPPKGVDFDYVFDPWMRSVTMVNILNDLNFSKEVKLYENKPKNSEMYYIIHPVLKHISILKNNNEI